MSPFDALHALVAHLATKGIFPLSIQPRPLDSSSTDTVLAFEIEGTDSLEEYIQEERSYCRLYWFKVASLPNGTFTVETL